MFRSEALRPRDAGYESYFLRGNDRAGNRAFWLRYTTTSVKSGPPVVEVFGALFGVGAEHARGVWSADVAGLERAHPPLRFETSIASLRVSEHRPTGAAQGAIPTSAGPMRWDMCFEGHPSPLLLLPEPLYRGPVPKAKALVPIPLARFSGGIRLGDEAIDLQGWTGSVNHNWGSAHTPRYAWGQVAGFEQAPEAFFEVATAAVPLGSLDPGLTATLGVLRVEKRELRFNGADGILRSRGSYRPFRWDLDLRSGRTRLSGTITASQEDFVGFEYRDPPGGRKSCLNSKVASAELTLEEPGRSRRALVSHRRAAFEILTDDQEHGIPMNAFRSGPGARRSLKG